MGLHLNFKSPLLGRKISNFETEYLYVVCVKFLLLSEFKY